MPARTNSNIIIDRIISSPMIEKHLLNIIEDDLSDYNVVSLEIEKSEKKLKNYWNCYKKTKLNLIE